MNAEKAKRRKMPNLKRNRSSEEPSDKSIHKYSLITVPDDSSESFSKSLCNCTLCVGMHLSALEWENFIPKTYLQKKMKHIVASIESKIREPTARSLAR